jgi:hypothetical protein
MSLINVILIITATTTERGYTGDYNLGLTDPNSTTRQGIYISALLFACINIIFWIPQTMYLVDNNRQFSKLLPKKGATVNPVDTERGRKVEERDE